MTKKTSLAIVFCSFVCLLLVLLATSLPAMAAPTVTSTSPFDWSFLVPEHAPVTATFSESMNPATITAESFTLKKQVGIVASDAGPFHLVALKGDGTVVAWGDNIVGETTVPAGLSGVVAIAAGGNHTVSLKDDGTVVAWGWNEYGQTTVPAGLSGVVAIAAGGNHTVALKDDGTVVAWGWNDDGQTTVPEELIGGVVAIAAGGRHTVALKDDGTVVAWGNNDYGQTTVPEELIGGVVAIAAGGVNTVALKDDGMVVAWGDNSYGQTTVPEELFYNVVAIATGGAHTVAMRYDGTVVAWGDNEYGQATVPEGLSGVVAIAAGGFNTVALKDDGTIIVWGDNLFGQTLIPTSLSPYHASVPATVVYDDSLQTATLTPEVPLAADSIYRATVFGRSALGTPMAESFSWGFSTGDVFDSYLVIPKAGMHGKISPAIGRLAMIGSTVAFNLTPDVGYVVDTVTGCDGSLVGNTYTTGPIGYTCTVTATFRLIPAVAPSLITVPTSDADGSYTVTWGASTTPGVIYELQEATNAGFFIGLRSVYIGTGTSANITGRTGGKTYYYRVLAQKAGYSDSAYRTAGNGCVINFCETPAWITVPTITTMYNSYSVTWGDSMSPDVTYELQEATNATFTAGLRQAYAGTRTWADITGRASGKTYYYRVRAQKAGYTTSAYRTAGNGCLVMLTCAVPASLAVPAANATGSYTINWGASSTAGAAYVLQEATNAAFTANLRQAYAGAALSATIVGRSSGVTYYYRVRAARGGYTPSAWTVAGNSCAVTQPCAAPANLTVPAASATGNYTISWGASSTVGAAYVLQETTNAAFTANLRQAYAGAALSAMITGRNDGVTYYYRVRAARGGYIPSAWTATGNGCLVGP